METEGGGLYFKSGIDNKQFDGAIAESTKRIQGMSDATVAAGDKIDKTFVGITNSANNSSNIIQKNATQELGRIEELRASISKLTEARDKSVSIEKIEAYNLRIKQETEDLKELTHAGLENADASKKQEDVTTTLTQSVGKWALSLGGAAYFLNLLKKAFVETTGGLNAFNVLGGITQQILYNIATGAQSFSDNLSGIIGVMRKFNLLRTEEYIDAVKSAKLNNAYQQLYSESLDASLSSADKIAKIDKALKVHNEAIDIQQKDVRKSIEATNEALTIQPQSEKYMKQLSGLYVKLENLEAERYQSTKRLVRQRSVLVQEGEEEDRKEYQKTIDLIRKAADEQIEINNSISEQEKLLRKAAEDGNVAEVLRIKGRIDLLQKELDIRINIAKAAILAASGGIVSKVTNIPEAPTFSTKPASTLAGAPTSEISKYISGTAMLTDEARAKQKDDREKETEDLKEQLDLRNQIGEAVGGLVVQLGESLGMSEKDLNQLGNAVESFTKLASGDYVGAAASMLSNLIALIPNEAEKFKAQIDTINLLLEEQQELIDESSRTGGKKEALEQYLKLLEENVVALLKALNYAAGQGKPTQDLIDQLNEARGLIDDTKLALEDLARGGITENTIADAIAQGFADGKTSVDDFADYMNDVLKDAVLNIFKQQILDSPAMEAYMDYIREALDGGVLTPEEKAKIDEMGAQMSADMKPYWDAMNQGLFSGEEAVANNTSLQGSIKGITEETASVLAGQFNAMRISQVDTNGIMRQQLMCLTEIAANSRYLQLLDHLTSIDSKISAGTDLRAQGLA